MTHNDDFDKQRGLAGSHDAPVREAPQNLSAGALIKEIGTEVTHLASKQIELAITELRSDLKKEAGTLAGLGIAGLAGLATANLLLVTGALTLAQWMPGWLAGLVVSAFTLLAAVIIAVVAWSKRVRTPLERTRRTVKDDVQWSKERLA